ncbi:sulfotransferase 1C4 [Caerostris extrusa]|uniref:Sulfotransferase 1C4 n=1 Tax=Caerostris extrusa TaxID=172846 RepID=A0AAV4W899_CAEEX|nr:sulfotransferase 1C4 [Caerostris extrusa]
MPRIPGSVVIDGKIRPPPSCPRVMRDAMNFKPDKEDIFVLSYPKCGTTLLTQIVALILRNGETFTTPIEYFSFIPYIEFTTLRKSQKFLNQDVLSHIYHLTSFNFSREAKYIYIARNPADCLMSYYHHVKYYPIYFFSDGSLDDIFDLFIKGKVDYDDYFDHLLSGYERRNEPNVLFLTYESILADRRAACLKIGHFL